MKRRTFVKSVVSGASAITLASCAGDSGKDADTRKTTTEFELEETTVAELAAGMRDGSLSSLGITERYLGRIEAVDRNGPMVNAVIELNPDAPEIAERLDRERKSGSIRGPLHGIPVLIKDNIDTADRMMTSAGSLALVGSIAGRDSFVAEKLRAAGAVILGKTNMSEWANFRSSRSTSGWSGRGGQTRNPFALDRNPSGSSSGSGAAVSASMCAISIGTETNGSIVGPATANGVVGIKPTVGLVGRSGIIPIAHSQDTAGPMGRTVADAVALLGAIVGADPRDAITGNAAEYGYSDYTQFLDPAGLKGKRIGVARGLAGYLDTLDAVFEESLAVIKSLGAELVDPADIETGGKYGSSSYDVLLFEFKAGINKYLSGLKTEGLPRSLEALIDFNEKNSDREMPWFGQEIFYDAVEKGDLSSKDYLDALEKVRRLSRDEGIDATLAKHKLDAIVAPTGGPAHLTDWINGDHFRGGSSSPAARAGYPNISVPAGFIFGLPVNISFFSKAWSEPVLIAMAYAFEQATMHRKAPRFLETVDFG